MSLYGDIKTALRDYIAVHHDQLIESVWAFYDDSHIAHDPDDDEFSVPEIIRKVRVSYVVHPDVEPRRGVPDLRYFWFSGDLLDLIAELDRMS